MPTTNTPPLAVTLNPEQQMYVIPCGDSGYSCWGYQNCWDELVEMTAVTYDADTAADLSAQKTELFGTLRAYEMSRELLNKFANSAASLRTWFSPGTPYKVRKVLEKARTSKLPIRLWYGGDDGKSWLDEHDMTGTIGRSTGPLRVPLLLPAGADGGGAILTDAVIRIRNEESGKDLYRQSNFHLPEMAITAIAATDKGLHTHALLVNGELWSRHESFTAAAAFVAWLAGEEHTPN